ncbi:MAG TPA: SDR family oxidoreductase [Acidimicrobiales bacterium]|nr:SDR family oxidoreductase [Acidimicrobiales bacterium]
MADRKVALVTGASRGIGKAVAVHLARAGFDVALGARTVQEGEAREHSSTIKASNTRPLPGSLATTAGLVEAEGRRALPVYLDLLDRASLGASVTTVLERWGRIDVLVNNGRYIGPGHMDLFLDTPIELHERHLEANVLAPIILTRLVLPQMLERGEGHVVNVTSSAGNTDPPGPAGQGGWGLGYGMSKGAMHRLAGILHLELGPQGICAYNLHPGFVATERMAADMGEFGFDSSQAAPADVVGAVAAWLVTTPEGRSLAGTWVEAQDRCRELGLVPGWQPAG